MRRQKMMKLPAVFVFSILFYAFTWNCLSFEYLQRDIKSSIQKRISGEIF